MKGFLLSAAFLALLAPSLGCRAAAEPVSLTYWSPLTASDQPYFEAMVKAFATAHPDIRLKTEDVGIASYYARLAEAVASGSPPDVVVLHQQRLVDLVPKGSLLPLDALAKAEGLDLDSFQPQPLADCRFDGRLYALPLDVHPIVMFYNKDLFAKVGIAAVPSTLPQLIAAARAIQAKTGAIGVAMDVAGEGYKPYTLARMFMSLLMEQGVTTLDANNTRANFNNGAGLKAYQVLSDLVNKAKVTPQGLTYAFSVDYFRTGRAGIHFSGVWVTGLFETQSGLNFGVAEFPPLLGKSASWSEAHVFALPVQQRPDARKLAAAMLFIDWMTDHAEVLARSGHIPARMTVLDKAEFKRLPHMGEYLGALAHSFEAPRTEKWTACYMAIADSLEESLALGRDAKSAVAIMERKVNVILGH